MEIRMMEPEERSLVEALRGSHKIINEMLGTWTSWKNWEKHPPMIAIDGGEVIALHGFTATKSGYINSYWLWVHEDYRGQQLAGKLIDATLQQRPEHCQRWKIRNHIGGDGYTFWTGFGLEPVGTISSVEEALFDFDIEGINSIKDLIEFADELNDIVTTDKRSLTHYRKLGVVFTHPDWKHLNG